ncbi:MAG TPA: ribosome maturation factor RimM [Rhizomicrobium sp.]|jgi:16S rRNA processing protein RimM|nr:ribosome maturation factor RimM [Rhizomicrobium sp.]
MTRDVVLGVVTGAHGLKGEVRVKTFTETPDGLGAYGPLRGSDGRVFTVADSRVVKAGEAVVRFEGVGTREQAEALKGVELHITREALPETDEEEFYHADLIGLRAEDEAGRAIGAIRAIHNFGAGDVIEIAREDGGNVLLPFTKRNVPIVEDTRIVIATPEDFEEKGNVE